MDWRRYQRRSMTYSSNSSLISGLELFLCARGVLDLYRALMPYYVRDHSDIAPQMILLHFNDCMYITYRCLTLGFEFQDRMPFERKELCIFIDMVYLFKDIAESWLRDHIVSSLRNPKNSLLSTIKRPLYLQRQPIRRDWMSY